jgi:hypothetical protein
MFNQTWKSEVIVDGLNLVLGGFLFLSPWILRFDSDLGWHTSWIAGATLAILAVLSIADLSEFVAISEVFESEEWINLAVGAWLVVCPWILRFDDDPLAMRTHLVVGLMVAAIAAVELWLIRHSPSPH